jgi:KDO2-lipid IV(A) lauroyltransferase
MKRAGDYLVYLVVRLTICIVQALPLATGHALARRLAWLFGDVLKVRAQVVDENLAFAFPELPRPERCRLARQMWEHLFLLAIEVAHTPRKLHETNWRDYVQLHDKAEFMRRLISGRPTMVVTGHFGNFEIGGYMLGILGFPTYSVARPLDNPYLDRFLARFRGATGQRLIPKNGGYEQIETVMRNGGILAFLADQYAGPKGCWVEFFGRPASAHKAIALLAFEHQAQVVVAAVPRRGRPMQFDLRRCDETDPLWDRPETRGVRELTQWFTAALEGAVRIWPDQYWWLHRRWKDPRPKSQPRQRAA